jgi:dsRNA-specific ribonuclease
VTHETPPPYLRPDVNARERSQIEGLLGPVPDLSLLRAVRDGRGRQFQRLEFLGDSVLDVVLNVHRWVEPGCSVCARTQQMSEASDHHLAEVAKRARLGEWLEWRASHERIADLVETCVAACWLTGSWPQVQSFVMAVVHPMGERTLQALVSGVAGEPGPAARRVGSAVLELESGSIVYRVLPQANEGVLSTSRALRHQAVAIAARARLLGDVGGRRFESRDNDTVLSEVEDLVAATVGDSGADAGLEMARPFVSTDAD